jgi:large subunit ribosomal protein L6
MSRIGKQPIVIIDKATVTITGNLVKVKGPNGELEYAHTEFVTVEQEEKAVIVKPIDQSKTSRAMWGLTRTLIDNMVVGVTSGFSKKLIFNGVGYRAAAKGNKLTLNLGYSHPIDYELPTGVTAKVVKNEIEISGASKELVGFVAAKVRSFRPPEPYKGKGIKYSDEVIIRKAGKTGAKK